jgi:hypothetical protein
VSNISAGLVTIAKIGDPAWLVVELGVEQITIQADGLEPINLDIDEARDLGNNLIVASWLLAITSAAKNQGKGGSLSSLLGIGELLEDE